MNDKKKFGSLQVDVEPILEMNKASVFTTDDFRLATEEEKQYQIDMLTDLHKTSAEKVAEHINILQETAIKNQNIFEKLMDATKVCSLGQITSALFEVGGQYRRNM